MYKRFTMRLCHNIQIHICALEITQLCLQICHLLQLLLLYIGDTYIIYSISVGHFVSVAPKIDLDTVDSKHLLTSFQQLLCGVFSRLYLSRESLWSLMKIKDYRCKKMLDEHLVQTVYGIYK